MKMKVFLFAALLVGFTGVKFAYPALTEYSEQAIQDGLKGQPLDLELENYKVSPPLVATADKVLAILKAGPLSIPIECGDSKVRAALGLFSGLKSSVSVESSCYEGQVRSESSKSILGEDFDSSFDIEGLKLSAHPLINFLKLAGEIDLKFESAGKVKGEELSSIDRASLDLKAREGSYSGDFKIAGLVNIPLIYDVDLDLDMLLEEESFSSEELRLSSSLGNAKGFLNGSFEKPLPEADLKSIEGRFEIELNDDGVKELSPYLALASGRTSDSKARKWLVTIAKAKDKPGQPKLLNLPIVVKAEAAR